MTQYAECLVCTVLFLLDFWEMNVSHSRCSKVLGLLCHIYHFIVHQMFSTDERSELQTGQFSTWTLLI